MGERVVRSLTTRGSVSVTVVIAKRETEGLFLVGKPGAEDGRNNSTALSIKVGSYVGS